MKKAIFILISFFTIIILRTVLFSEPGLKIIKQTDNSNLPDFNQVAEEAANDLQKYIRI